MAYNVETLIEMSKLYGDNADVATPSNEYVQMEAWRHLPRALMVGLGKNGSGDEGLLDNAHIYLPQMPGEFLADYEFRRDHLSHMPPLFPDSIGDLVSACLASPIFLSDEIPKEIRDPDGVWANIDLDGKSGDAFLAGGLTGALAEAIDYILVDYPSVPRELDELQRRLLDPRVYWCRVPGRCVTEVTYRQHGSRIVIQRAKVVDLDWQLAGEWGRRAIVRIKVYRRGNPYAERGDDARYASAEIFEGKPAEQLVSIGTKVIRAPSGLPDELDAEFAEVPLYPMYGQYIGPHYAKPFLPHTAELCRKLLMLISDRSNIEHWANAVTLIVNGMSREAFDNYNKSHGATVGARLGAGGRLHVNGGPGNQQPLFFLEHRGQAIDSLRKSVEELKDDIRRSVAEAATKNASVIELATVRFFNEGQKASRLRLVQTMLQESVIAAMRRTCLYYKTPISAAAITFPKINTSHLIDLKEKREYVVRGKEASVMSVRTANEQAVLTGLVETTLSPEAFADQEIKRHKEEMDLFGDALDKETPGSAERVDVKPTRPLDQGEDGMVA